MEVIKIDKMDPITLILITLLIVLLIIFLKQHGWFPLVKIPDLHCKEGNEAVPLKLEQLAACYKGCQFATQPSYNITPIKIMIKL